MATHTLIPEAQASAPNELEGNQGRNAHGSRDDGREMVPEVRYCNWESFMNRFSDDEPSYAIEALVPGADFEREIADETLRRHRQGVKPYEEEPDDVVTRIRQQRVAVERIRIRSKPLLNLFTRLTGYSWGEKSRTFTQPFKYFVHYHETFHRELGILREEALQINTSSQSEYQDGESHVEFEPETLRHLECFVNFAENNIMQLIRDFRKTAPSKSFTVRFDHLWYSFRPGDLIFVPPMTLRNAVKSRVGDKGVPETGLGHESSMQQTIWKLHGIWSFQNAFRVYAYYLDFDGTSYNAVPLELDIWHFQGEREVRELAFYPLRFASHFDQLIAESKRVGRLYTNFLQEWHIAYNGWSLVTDPMGVPILDPDDELTIKRQIRPAHIEGDMIVDFREAFNSNPEHRSTFFSRQDFAFSAEKSYLTFETHPFMVWSDSQRSTLTESRSEFLFQTNDLDLLEQEDYWATEKYLDPAATIKDKLEVAEDDWILLPRRLFAYALHERVFVPIDVRFMKSITVQENAFEQLQLPDTYRSMLKAAVESHIRRLNIEKQLENKGDSLRTQDFIRGKGRGLNIMRKPIQFQYIPFLLFGMCILWITNGLNIAVHGEPGVGKTATAEAVAQWTRRPLFPMSMGGFRNAYDAESKMEEILRLAHLWGCITLLDEADVFLTARSGSAKNYNNELVSVFLRKIEYFNGILILTTNRIGKLDQALGSRIHLILHYKRLGLAQSLEIFRLNIQRLREAEEQQCRVSGEKPVFVVESAIMKFAADHYNKFPKGKGAWNGRQIRNAFLLATSLARDEAQQINDPAFQPQLRYEHFENIERMTREYDHFRARVLGGDDARKARLNEERDDDFDVDETTDSKQRSRYGGMESAASGVARPMPASPRSLSSLVRVGPNNPPMSHVDPAQGIISGLSHGGIPRPGGTHMAPSVSQGSYASASYEEMNPQTVPGNLYASRQQQHLSPYLVRPGHPHFTPTGSALDHQPSTGGSSDAN
ncbi:hypothetical protein PG993_009166 [Apiospora rasikravindrae]|uniref:AAA+ ATPase domain-containing protein n=1 Tax=Apiospora rasikravindrae TaxID=990691 RepID=A0ABR1SIL6_9PEZI